MSQVSTIKKGQYVKYRGRVSEGKGKVIAIRKSERGNWYDVQAVDGRTISLRLAQITAI